MVLRTYFPEHEDFSDNDKCCQICGNYRAKYSVGRVKFCFNCIDIAKARTKCVHDEMEICYPRYSDDLETRKLYHSLMSAPNSKFRGW